MTGLDIICPGCRKSYHSTTELYDPALTANGAMVRLKEPWRKWGWCTFGDAGNGLPPKIAERKDTYWSVMDCPGCGAPMAPSGKLTVKEPEGKPLVEVLEPCFDNLSTVLCDEAVTLSPEFVCQVCGRECKSNAGLVAHMRSHAAANG